MNQTVLINHRMLKFIISISIVLSQILFAQITSTKTATIKRDITPYDSLRNYVGEDYQQYIGKEFYVLPKALSSRKYGYEGFQKNMNKGVFASRLNIYKCCNNLAGFNSKYSALAGRYFKVIDVFDNINDDWHIFLKLKANDTDKIVYYKYDYKYEHNFPFLVIGYYEKLKQIYVGKEFLIRPASDKTNYETIVDINTGQELTFEHNDFSKCIDITIDEKYYAVSMLFENKKSNRFLLPYRYLDTKFNMILPKNEVSNYIKKFGIENWQTIFRNDIRIGFTEEMVLVAWGRPNKINRASYGDQWVYENRYLYFKNGKLTSFN